MLRFWLVCLIPLLMAACASVPEAPSVLASARSNAVSEELECLCDCLGEADGTIETCSQRCID